MSQEKKTTHGGARPGAGRKAKATGKLIFTAVRLDEETRAAALKIGDGSMAEGIRRAIAQMSRR
jgi:hypothetical protein